MPQKLGIRIWASSRFIDRGAFVLEAHHWEDGSTRYVLTSERRGILIIHHIRADGSRMIWQDKAT